jgi:pimeloyl-ACP methyl ester carboxylesterase
MLVAGTGYSGHTWAPTFLDLLTNRYQVVTFDHRGTGHSPGSTSEYTTARFARDALAVLRAADLGPAHIVGHSMGGRVAQEMYFADPSMMRSLTLAASGAGTPTEPEYSRVGIPVPAVQRMMDIGYEGYVWQKHRDNFFTDKFIAEHQADVEWLDKAFFSPGPTLRNYLKHVRARQAHSTTERLRQLAAPTHIVIGTKDTHNGGTGSHYDEAHRLHGLVPHAHLSEIDGAKHGFMWEQPDLTVNLIHDFTLSVEHTKHSN